MGKLQLAEYDLRIPKAKRDEPSLTRWPDQSAAPDGWEIEDARAERRWIEQNSEAECKEVCDSLLVSGFYRHGETYDQIVATIKEPELRNHLINQTFGSSVCPPSNAPLAAW